MISGKDVHRRRRMSSRYASSIHQVNIEICGKHFFLTDLMDVLAAASIHRHFRQKQKQKGRRSLIINAPQVKGAGEECLFLDIVKDAADFKPRQHEEHHMLTSRTPIQNLAAALPAGARQEINTVAAKILCTLAATTNRPTRKEMPRKLPKSLAHALVGELQKMEFAQAQYFDYMSGLENKLQQQSQRNRQTQRSQRSQELTRSIMTPLSFENIVLGFQVEPSMAALSLSLSQHFHLFKELSHDYANKLQPSWNDADRKAIGFLLQPTMDKSGNIEELNTTPKPSSKEDEAIFQEICEHACGDLS